MHIMKKAILLYIVTMLTLVLGATTYNKIELKTEEIKAMEIGTFTISTKTNEKGVSFSAVVDFDDKDGYTQNSNIEVVVVKIYKRAGERVAKGDKIVELSSNALNELYFSLQNTKSRYDIAKEIEIKDKELLNQGVISQRAYQTSYLNMNELQLKMNEVRTTLSSFGIDPDNPKGDYGFLVRAIGSGTLSVSPMEIGQKIPAFSPYVRISKPHSDNVLLRIRVPQNRSSSIKTGYSVFDIYGNKIGVVESVSAVVNRQTNTMSAVARVESKRFKVGEIVEIYVAGGLSGKMVVIPDDCWVKFDNDYVSFVKTDTGFLPVSIKIIEERDGHSVVMSDKLNLGVKIARGSLVILKGIMTGLGKGE